MKIQTMVVFCSFLMFAFAAHARTATCPDITGIYTSDEGALIKYVQTNCTTLTRMMGIKSSDGSIQYSVDRDFSLDGTPVCNAYNSCESAQATQNTINFTLNFNSSIRTDDHGLCSHHGDSLKKDSDSNLIATFYVYDCANGFKGQFTKVFRK